MINTRIFLNIARIIGIVSIIGSAMIFSNDINIITKLLIITIGLLICEIIQSELTYKLCIMLKNELELLEKRDKK